MPPRAHTALAVAAVVALAFAGAGCSRVPVAANGAEARARLLALSRDGDSAARGVADVNADVAGRGGAFEARWGASGESLVVVGYAGPARIVDAALLRDSLYIGARRQDFAVAGVMGAREGLGAEGLQFLLRPWDFGRPWVREAIERAAVEESREGFRLRGAGRTGSGEVRFALDLTTRGEPRRLELSRPGADRPLAVVRYGPLQRYAAGRYPRWVSWERERARIRLDVREVGPLPEGRLRLLPPPPSEWRVVGLDDADGRAFLSRLVGDSE